MYVSSKESLRKKVAAEESLTRGELKVVGKLLDRLEKLKAVVEAARLAVNYADSAWIGYEELRDALAALEDK